MIYEIENGFVISAYGMWLPGAFDTRRAANYAFRFPNEKLYEICLAINGRHERLITFDDLKEARRGMG